MTDLFSQETLDFFTFGNKKRTQFTADGGRQQKEVVPFLPTTETTTSSSGTILVKKKKPIDYTLVLLIVMLIVMILTLVTLAVFFGYFVYLTYGANNTISALAADIEVVAADLKSLYDWIVNHLPHF